MHGNNSHPYQCKICVIWLTWLILLCYCFYWYCVINTIKINNSYGIIYYVLNVIQNIKCNTFGKSPADSAGTVYLEVKINFFYKYNGHRPIKLEIK